MFKFVAETDRAGEKLIHKNPNVFPYEEWVPAIELIFRGCRTAIEQKTAITDGVLGAMGRYSRIRIIEGRQKARTRLYGGEARFRLDGNLNPRLSFVRMSGIDIGYQSATEEITRPAFAVVDSGEYHRVIRNQDEILDDMEIALGEDVAASLAKELNNYYPGWDIYNRLDDRNIVFVA